MKIDNLNELFKEWLKNHRFLKQPDDPIYVYDLCEFFEYCEKYNHQSKTTHTGKWIQVDDTKCMCNQCEDIIYLAQAYGDKNYCPNCGAKMEKDNA